MLISLSQATDKGEGKGRHTAQTGLPSVSSYQQSLSTNRQRQVGLPICWNTYS